MKQKKFIFVFFGVLLIVLLFGGNHLRKKYVLYRNLHDSMLPGIRSGETILVKRISAKEKYSFHRGQVVIFSKSFEKKKNGAKNALMLKQLVALPGDRVDFLEKVVITSSSGQETLELSSTYLQADEGMLVKPFDFIKRNPSGILLDKDEYFVLGTNPDKSLDSREFGPIKREKIIGVAQKSVPINGKEMYSK